MNTAFCIGTSKPGNILLDANCEPHLTDFGLARLVESENSVIQTLDVLGTPSYGCFRSRTTEDPLGSRPGGLARPSGYARHHRPYPSGQLRRSQTRLPVGGFQLSRQLVTAGEDLCPPPAERSPLASPHSRPPRYMLPTPATLLDNHSEPLKKPFVVVRSLGMERGSFLPSVTHGQTGKRSREARIFGVVAKYAPKTKFIEMQYSEA